MPSLRYVLVAVALTLAGCRSTAKEQAKPEPMAKAAPDAGSITKCRGRDIDLYEAFEDHACDLDPDAGALAPLPAGALGLSLTPPKDHVPRGTSVYVAFDIVNASASAVVFALDNGRRRRELFAALGGDERKADAGEPHVIESIEITAQRENARGAESGQMLGALGGGREREPMKARIELLPGGHARGYVRWSPSLVLVAPKKGSHAPPTTRVADEPGTYVVNVRVPVAFANGDSLEATTRFTVE